MSQSNLQLCIDRYFKCLNNYEEQNLKCKQNEERINKIKERVCEFLVINKRRCVIVYQMFDHINKNIFKWDDDDKRLSYYEVYSFLRNNMKFGLKNVSQHPPWWFQNWLE